MKKRKYRLTFDFVKTIDEANKIIAQYNKTATPYQKRKYPARVTPWSAKDRSFDGYVVFRTC